MSLTIDDNTAHQILDLFAQGLTTLEIYTSLNFELPLATFALPGFSTPANRRISVLNPVIEAADRTGVASHFLATGNGLWVQGTVSTAGGGGDVIIDTTLITEEDDITLQAWTLHQSKG